MAWDGMQQHGAGDKPGQVRRAPHTICAHLMWMGGGGATSCVRFVVCPHLINGVQGSITAGAAAVERMWTSMATGGSFPHAPL